MRSIVSRAWGSVVVVAWAVVMGTAHAAEREIASANVPEAWVSPAGSEAPEAGTAAAESTATGTKMSLEQVRAAMAAAEKTRQEALKPDPAIDNRLLAEQWGVEVIGIQRTAGGYMLDFRFEVVDAEKALPLFDHRIKPYVVAKKSDIKLPVPMAAKVGAFRPTNRGKNIKADKIYYMIFANPDSYVKPGEKVSVFIGDFKAENLTVR